MKSKLPSPAWTRITLLFFGHLLNDGYGSFFAPLLPLLINRLDLSLAMAGLAGTLHIALSAFTQPALGYVLDRTQRLSLVVIGPFLTICAMSMIGRAVNFTQLLVLMAVAGLGTALFHPAAAILVSGGNAANRGLRMAFFSAGGTIGGAITPLFIVVLAATFGLTSSPWLLIPGLLSLAVFTLFLRRHLPKPVRQTSTTTSLRAIPRQLIILWLAIVFRSMATVSFLNFLAVIITGRGGSPFAGGVSITVYLFAGAMGGFLAGNLSDRFGRKVVFFACAVLSTPFFLLFLYGPPSLGLVSVAMAGLFIFSSTPVGVVAAQELLPRNTGLVSGFVMGFAWGVSGLILVLIGRYADLYGLLPVMTGAAFLPLVAGALILFYRDPHMKASAAQPEKL